jgi:hypothetical protein
MVQEIYETVNSQKEVKIIASLPYLQNREEPRFYGLKDDFRIA